MAYAVWHGVITDLQGNVVPGAQVEVRSEVTGALVRLYEDRDGAAFKTNPFQADGQGQASFFAAGGAYRIIARSGSFERVWRYVGIGTAQEADVEALGMYLQAGLITVQTKTALNAIIPESFPMGGVVLADPVGANNGYYTNQGSGWVFARPLPDTFARLYVTGGTANAVQATLDAGVNPSAPSVFFIDVETPNTGPVTITINGANTGPVLNVAGNSLAAGEWQGRILFTRESNGDYKIVLNDPASALSAALSATQAGDARDAAQAARVGSEDARDDAAASAAAAVTSESNAASSASNAATSESNAAASETAAAGSASTASSAATTATTQAANAASSASDAATSEANAAASEAAAGLHADRSENEADRSEAEANRAEAAASSISNPVSYNAQSPSSAEQAQARLNLGITDDANFVQEQDSRTSAQGQSFKPDVKWVRTAGFAAPGDGGGALYKRVSSEPSHAGKFQSADGAWWELAENVVSSASVPATLAQMITAANTRDVIIEPGTITLDSLTSFTSAPNVRVKGRHPRKSILKRGSALASAISFNQSPGTYLSDITLNMDFAATGQSGHGIIFVDSDDVEARNITVSDLGNNGGTAGSGIISYKSEAAPSPVRNKIIDSTVLANVSLSDNTNGFLLTDTRFSQMRGNVASGIAAFAHEYKNDARYNTGSDLIAINSAYALGFGQTTTGTDGVDYTAVTNVVASACDVGFVLGEGSYNAVNNLIVNTDSSPNKALGGKVGVRLSGGAVGNLVTDVVSVGTGTMSAIRIDGSNRNHVSIAIHDGSTDSINFTGTAAGNFVEVLHTGLKESIEGYIADSTGNPLAGANANVVHSPSTGERLGSRSGYFKDSFVRSGGATYLSSQRWRFDAPDNTILAMGLPNTSGQMGLACNVGSTVNAGALMYNAASQYWSVNISNAGVARFASASWHPVADNSRTLGVSGVRFSTIYAATGTINTSDAREKKWRGGLNKKEIAVAKRLSKLVGIYRWKEAVAAKGKYARLHAGVLAQDVINAFEAEGLDPFKYGVVCYDQWEANEEDCIAAGDRYGVRHDELWAFVAAGFEARLTTLESVAENRI